MKTKIIKKINFLFLILILFTVLPYIVNSDTDITEKLQGRILLQVEKNGEAWYLPPGSGQRVYLGRPADAFKVMRECGEGMEHARLKEFLQQGFPSEWEGRIVLDVERNGRAYYVSPADGEGEYLGRPRDALRVMKEEGVGITDQKLNSIPVKKDVTSSQDLKQEKKNASKTEEGMTQYSWQYQGEEYQLGLELHRSIYEYYRSQPSEISYKAGEVPSDWKKDFYRMYLNTDKSEDVYSRLATKIESLGKQYGLTEEKIPELILSFVQSISYDDSLADKIMNDPRDASMKYPYEVLYENKGTCGGKSFLTVLLFRRLGYGTALFEFEADDHMAAGIECSSKYSTYGSGYCYAETTTVGHPIGVLPTKDPTYFVDSEPVVLNISTSPENQDLTELTDGTLYQRTEGRTYSGIEESIEKMKTIRSLKKTINQQKTSLKELREERNILEAEIEEMSQTLKNYKENGQYEEYNELLSVYNDKVEKYEQKTEEYNALVKRYNNNTNEYNSLVNSLYPQE